ncbi:sterol desaturase family protein [Ilyomonas limi]|uniref:Sterol desaturase family protein n=1 Tax=Ilyomonas limi TaxID=2575867 RepID=A0A4U3KUR3_9BACT|nr:sterol desaturase family protein [Ilyomonas limi]TKK66130.1 sterol desaturase family protein [Ilyomonas limi]
MEFLKDVQDWFVGFFGIRHILDVVHSGDYSSLLSLDGLTWIIAPLFPVLLFLEIMKALIFRKFRAIDYKIPFFSYVLNAFIGRFLSIGLVVVCIGLFEKYAIIKISFTWYWFIYGYIVWEFGHFIYHYLGHKVRLFWCLHSTHHAPEAMNLSVSYAHFFLEGPYADFIRTTVCILLGVPPPMLFLIMFIDGVWGGFIHIGEHMMRDGKLGPLHKFILTPMHHRVHHAKNPLYMDTNFCNLLNIWDRVFGTYQLQEKTVPITYGITREMAPNSFLDAYFGEFGALIKDIRKAPGIKNKFLYLIMPPGWSHTGDHKTASKVKKEYFQNPRPEIAEEARETPVLDGAEPSVAQVIA